MKEFPIYKSIDEATPEVLIESIDTSIPKVLHSFKLNFADLVQSNKEIADVPHKAYKFEGSSKQIYMRVKFL